MDPHRVRAVAKRIVLGFRRDHRSLGLLFAAPILVLSLVGAVWGGATERVPVVVSRDRPVLGTSWRYRPIPRVGCDPGTASDVR